jgi:uncharacterized protein involved in propanediol utilization
MSGPTVVARRPGVDVRTGTGHAFGTFGELLQGALPGGDDFLVTLPITRASTAWFRLEPGGPLRVFPSHKAKSRRLAGAMLEAHGRGAGGTLVIDSDLPIGKGLASSSADLVAAARAVGDVLGLDTSPPAVETLLRPIEPTDGVMHPGVVVFEHRRVRLRSVLGALPPLTVVAVDEGGAVDTVAFNRRPKQYTERDLAEYAGLLDLLADAVRTGDLRTVGGVASRSAQLNQRLVPKRNLTGLLAVARGIGALGVVAAHSGTVLGLLLADGDPDHAPRLRTARAACARLGPVAVYHTTS